MNFKEPLATEHHNAHQSAVGTAVQRLNASRAQLQLALRSGGQDIDSPNSQPATPRASNFGRSTFPSIDLILHAFKFWWSQHPLHTAVSTASLATQAVIRPVAQSYPVALVTVALVAGGALVYCRPWRWLGKPALIASFLPQILSVWANSAANKKTKPRQ